MNGDLVREPNRFYVYVYKDLNGSPFYVGKGSGKRWKGHICEAIKGKDNLKCEKIREILDSGNTPIIEKLIENIDDELALLIEQEYILKFGRIDIGTGILTNMTSGGDGPPKWEDLSEESRDKIRNTLINYTLNFRVVGEDYRNKISNGLKRYFKENEISEETRKKISKANSGENNPMYGKHHSDEIKEHLRQVNLGKILSEEHRQRISVSMKKIRFGKDNPMYGKHHSEESKRLKSIGSKNFSNKYKEENGGKHWNSGKTPSEETLMKMKKERKCPHCGKIGRGSAMKRWHFDKCKFKNVDN